jgi:hypothetical protein
LLWTSGVFVGRRGLHLAFEDPGGLTQRPGHAGQPLGAEQQHNHNEEDHQMPPG